MGSGFREFVEEVRAAVELVDVISEDVQLKNSGNVLKGLSPFRSEQHPSFCVWPKEGRWYDFAGGDGQGGDVFSYIQKRDGVGFKEAVFTLAERKGVRRPDQDEEVFQKELALLVERREVEKLLTKAAAYYHSVLPRKIREESYQQHYGFTDETIDGLMLGFSDGHLFQHFREELKVSRELALKTGLFVVIKGGRVEDFFRDRLVLPYWKGGQVAYFIARSTQYTGDEAWERSKYKKLLTYSERHSYVSTTVRNDTFFGEDAVRGAEQILITEGITDAISAKQAGIPCISPVTTRFRKKDIPKLLNLTRAAARVVICNDAEESGAGAAGALETASALHEAGRDVRIAVLPRPEDIDKIDVNEFLKANPPKEFEAVLNQAKRYVEHLIEAIPKETPATDLEPLLEPVLKAVNVAGKIEGDAYLDAIVKRFGIRRRALSSTLKGVEADQRRKAASRRVEESETPVVRINGRQLRSIIEDARGVAVEANAVRVHAGADAPPKDDDPPLLFRRGGAVVRLKADEEAAVELAQWGETAMFGLLARDADWVTVDEEGAHHPAFPPKDVSRDLVTFPPNGFPRVDAVITTPVFGTGGDLIVSPGLHRDEHLWLQADPTLVLDEVPKEPTADEVARARSLFVDDLFVDFPFATDSDRAHMLAAVLLPFARRMVHGNTPLHVVESPSIGSGKSLLCHLASIVCTGKGSDISTLPGQEEEIRKTLTAELLKGCPIIVLDNANERRVLSSQALAAALTAPTWRNRILGKTEIIVLPNMALWMLTGNNPRLSAELTRRSIRIRIDPKRDRAWQRTGFKHDPISMWAKEHRSELVHSALLLIQAWIAAGKPRCTERLGSFEDWAAVMGGILDAVGVPGFLANLEQMYADADSEGEIWREFTQAWWAEFGPEPKRVSELNELCENEGLMLTVRGDGAERSQQVRLGKALLGARDRMFGDLRLEAEQTRHRSRQYALHHASNEQPLSSEPLQEEIDPWD